MTDVGDVQLRRTAWKTVHVGLAVEALTLVVIWGAWLLTAGGPLPEGRDYASPLGWAATVGAAVVWGFSEVPIKVPESQALGPTLFNAYGFVANGLTHLGLALLLCLPAHGPWRLHWQGAVAALDIMLVQSFARSAVWLLGIAVAPPLWCAIGMSTSFAWGTAVFGDRPGHWNASLFGLGLLMAGIGLVSMASVVSSRASSRETAAMRRRPSAEVFGRTTYEAAEAAEDTHPKTDEAEDIGLKAPDAAPDAPNHSQALLHGLAYALGAGFSDGSLTAFYQQVEGAERRPEGAGGAATTVFIGYFVSFGLCATSVGLAIIGTTLAFQGRRGVGGTASGAPATGGLELSKALPGAASGALWAGANSCSVLASHFLGMSLSFPLTQTAAVFSGLIGIVIFSELSGRGARTIFGVAMGVIVVGAGLLSAFGRPA